MKGMTAVAREARKISKSGRYSVSLCGRELFKNSEDEKTFLEMLEKYFEDGEVYAYSLSDTEIRLVVKEAPKGISMTMKPLLTSYARYYNRTHNAEGKLFSGRFRSNPIESDEEMEEAIDNLKNKAPQKPRKPVKKTEKKSEGNISKKQRDTKTDNTSETPRRKPAPKPAKRNSMPSYLL